MTEGTLIGHCGVDSGQIMLIDPCYVFKDDFDGGDTPTGGSYDEACRVTLAEGAGQIQNGLGVVTRTYIGDGNYPVYADMEGKRVKSVTIVFDGGWGAENLDLYDEEDEW